jgi:allantoate deiminase
VDGAALVARCRELAAISEQDGCLVRPFGSDAMARANALAGGWMEAAGLAMRVDAAGNLVGSVPGHDAAAGTLLLGSHLDTVRDAGAFDGPLGVVTAIACAEELRAREVTLPFALDVYGFSDEEGLRFGTAYLGSGAVAGGLDPAALELRDADGIALRDALGGDAAAASRAGERLRGYLEVHIEQGPVLEARGVPVGVVTAIAGATRAEVRLTGAAGHAGTVPMDARRDAACAVAELVLAVEAAARERPGLVATVGRLEALPGAPNVIPGAATASIDVRHADDAVREDAVAALRERAAAIGAARGVEVAWEPRMATPAVAMDPGLAAALAGAVRQRGLPLVELPSGAGHDAVALSAITGTAMLFVRCAGGVSHNPAESVEPADAQVALEVLVDTVLALAG